MYFVAKNNRNDENERQVRKKRYFLRVAIFVNPTAVDIRDVIFDGMKSFREIATRFEIVSHQLKLDLLFHIRIYRI